MELTVAEQKKRLRNKFLTARKALSSNDLLSKSRFIASKFINTKAYQQSQIIHSYVSINRQNEVETRNLIHHMLDHGKKVVVPKMEKEGKLSHYRIRGLDDLIENNWGVSEPAKDNSQYITSDSIELVIVPMVSGDMDRNRLGYGKGFYDRFLEDTEAVKIGFLFDIQLYGDRLPTDRFDVQLDMLITESMIVS